MKIYGASCVEGVVVWLKQRYKKLSTENYVEWVLIVATVHVTVQKHVRTVLSIAVHAHQRPLHLLLRIAEMVHVMAVKIVPHVLEIVVLVLHLPLIVGMEHVM